MHVVPTQYLQTVYSAFAKTDTQLKAFSSYNICKWGTKHDLGKLIS